MTHLKIFWIAIPQFQSARDIKYLTWEKRNVSATKGKYIAEFHSPNPISWISWNIQTDVSSLFGWMRIGSQLVRSYFLFPHRVAFHAVHGDAMAATRSFARVSWRDCNQHLSILPPYDMHVVCRMPA